MRVFPYVLQIWWLCFQTALLDVFRNDDATPNLTSHLSFLSKEIRCTRKQQSEGEFDNPLTSNVEIENAWTHTATPPIPIWCSVYTWENVALNVSSWTQRIHGRSPPLKHKRHRSLSWAKRIQSTFTKSTTLIQRKLKWSRYRSCVAQGVGRCVALLFHDRGTRRGWVVSSTARPHFTPGKDPVPILQEAGWAPRAGLDWWKISSPLEFDPGPSSLYSVVIPTELPSPHYFNIHVNNTLSSMPRSTQWPLPLRFPHLTPLNEST